MSKELEFIGYWEGDIVYRCDCCNCNYRFPFISRKEAMNITDNRDRLKADHGWILTKVNGFWRDFCSEKCKNRYIMDNAL